MRFNADLVTLFMGVENIRRPVWRRVQASAFSKLGGIHKVVQALFGWDDTAPHRFILAGDIYQRVAHGEALDPKRERNWRLDSAFYPDKSFTYEYGLNDLCRVQILLEEYAEGFKNWRYPRCIGGAGNLSPAGTDPFDVGAANHRLWRAVRRQ